MPNIYFAGQVLSAMPEGSILQLDITLLFRMAIHWLNIAVLAVFMYRLLYKPVKNFMAQRTQRIQGEIVAASAANEKASGLKQKYEDIMDNIEAEKQQIMAQAQAQAIEKSDQILFDARQEAKFLLQKAEDRILTERKNAAEENKKMILDLSTKIAAHFVHVSIDEQVQGKFLDEALTDWSENTWRG